MRVEKLKYIIWAQGMDRAVRFYCDVFDAVIVRRSEVMAEIEVAGSIIDLFAGCDALRAAGGTIIRPPEDTPEEPAHLAMCADPEGTEIMLTRARKA